MEVFSLFLDPTYISTQLKTIIPESITDLAELMDERGFLDTDTPLFIMKVDLKRSLDIADDELRYLTINSLSLVSATDAAARGGIVFNKTDGIEAFFKDERSCIKSAMTLFHRRQEIREKIFKGIFQDFSSSVEPEKLASVPSISEIDYRVCILEFPNLTKETIFLKHGNKQDITSRLVTAWEEASSRLANKQIFLISKEMYQNIQDESLKAFFNTEKLIEIEFSKTNRNQNIEDILGHGFYPYNGNLLEESYADEAPVYESEGNYSSDSQEKELQRYLLKKSNWYDQNFSKLDDKENRLDLFQLFSLETPTEYNPSQKAAVLGDINLDYITYLDASEVPAPNTAHIQIQKPIQKAIAGKGMIIARALQRTKEFNPILLVGKIGSDFEGQYIIQSIKQESKYINKDKPLLYPCISFSYRNPTGTSISIRKSGQKSSVITVTDKPNANSDLTQSELRNELPKILSCDYFFISGYCLLDGRIEIIETILELIAKRKDKYVVLEFSPRGSILDFFSDSPERENRLKKILENVFLISYEVESFGEHEKEWTDCIPYKVRFDFSKNLVEERVHAGDWKKISRRVLSSTSSSKRSLGLMSDLTAAYVDSKFIKPKILLCSNSPRRFSLLSSVYGKSNIRLRKVEASISMQESEFLTETEAVGAITKVSLSKLKYALKSIENDEVENYQGIKVALTSNQGIFFSLDDRIISLGKPDDFPNPLLKARAYLSDFISGKQHEVWTVTCFINFAKLKRGSKSWNLDYFHGLLAYLEQIINGSSSFSKEMYRMDSACSPNTYTLAVAEDKNYSLDLTVLACKSTLRFKELSAEEIDEYLACSEWRGKGGGYAVQGSSGYLVKEIDGLFTNVVGLPMIATSSILSQSSFRIGEQHC